MVNKRSPRKIFNQRTDRKIAEQIGTFRKGEYCRVCELLEKTIYGEEELNLRVLGFAYYIIFISVNDKEVFVKVGITGSKNVLTRFSGPSKNGGYDIIPLFTGQANPQYIHQYEYELKSLLKGLSYTPENIFAGSNECFNNISKEALDVLSQYTFTNILLDDLDSLPSILLFNKKVKSRKGLAA